MILDEACIVWEPCVIAPQEFKTLKLEVLEVACIVWEPHKSSQEFETLKLRAVVEARMVRAMWGILMSLNPQISHPMSLQLP